MLIYARECNSNVTKIHQSWVYAIRLFSNMPIISSKQCNLSHIFGLNNNNTQKNSFKSFKRSFRFKMPSKFENSLTFIVTNV